MGTTEPSNKTDTVLKRIAWLSANDAEKQFDCLMHLFNEDSLAACFHALDGKKAVGADGVTKADYGAELEDNLRQLTERMKRMGYRPGPVRRVLIPKDGSPGATRPLGISNVEDKLVQAMMHRVLEAIYEPLFRACSYGFRPGRGAHDAVRALHQHLYRHEVQSVIDVDLAGFFDSIDHDLLVEMVSEKVADKRLIRYLSRLLKAGVLMDGELKASEEGTPQGSMCSPVLANIFAHGVIDVWFEDTVKRHCVGRVELFRYADDLVICCQHARDAERIHRALGQRLAKYRLALNEAKTRRVRFTRPMDRGSAQRAAFDFLGFTFYWGRSRKGHVIPKVKTSGKRLRSKLKRVTAWIRMVHSRQRLMAIWRVFRAKVAGHLRYYGVSFNTRALAVFVHQAMRIIYKWLNRRSQRRSFNWVQFGQFVAAHPLPRPVIYHSLFERGTVT